MPSESYFVFMYNLFSHVVLISHLFMWHTILLVDCNIYIYIYAFGYLSILHFHYLLEIIVLSLLVFSVYHDLT